VVGWLGGWGLRALCFWRQPGCACNKLQPTCHPAAANVPPAAANAPPAAANAPPCCTAPKRGRARRAPVPQRHALLGVRHVALARVDCWQLGLDLLQERRAPPADDDRAACCYEAVAFAREGGCDRVRGVKGVEGAAQGDEF